jgi:hypothetical protein
MIWLINDFYNKINFHLYKLTFESKTWTDLQVVNGNMPGPLVIPFPIIIQTVDLNPLQFQNDSLMGHL